MMKKQIGRWAIFLSILLVLWLLVAPPRWWLNLTKPVDMSDPVAAGTAVVAEYDCRNCHRIDGWGGLMATTLDGVTNRLDDGIIRTWLRNPRAVDSATAMPNLRLSDAEIEAVLAYLKAVDGSG